MENSDNTSAKVEGLALEELQADAASGDPVASRSLDVVRDVQVQLTAVLGGTTMTVGELFALKEDGVVTLDTLVDQPVDLLLNQQVVARGALVVADEHFAVQITEVPDAGGLKVS